MLDLAVEHLTSNSNLTFVWAEVLFIERWFNLLTKEKKEEFQKWAKFVHSMQWCSGKIFYDESNPIAISESPIPVSPPLPYLLFA